MVLKVATGVTGSGLSFTAAEGCICDVVNVAAAEDGKLADLSLAAERAAVKLNAAADVEVVPVPDDVLPNSDLSPEPDPYEKMVFSFFLFLLTSPGFLMHYLNTISIFLQLK